MRSEHSTDLCRRVIMGLKVITEGVCIDKVSIPFVQRDVTWITMFVDLGQPEVTIEGDE